MATSTAYRRFGYDPDGAFSHEESNAMGFASPDLMPIHHYGDLVAS